MAENEWKYLLINGKSKRVEVKNPIYKSIELQTIEGLRPFDKNDSEGNWIYKDMIGIILHTIL